MSQSYYRGVGLFAAPDDPQAVSKLDDYFIVNTGAKRLVESQPTIVAAEHTVRCLNQQEALNGRPPVFAVKTLREIS